jgi:hypothetical protein
VIHGVSEKLSNHFRENIFPYLLAVICFVQIISIERVDYSNYHPTHDVKSYRQMAMASPSFDDTVMKPFAYRLLAPWLVGFLFQNIDLGFFVLNIFFSILFVLTLFIFLTKHHISKPIAFVITAAFIFNRYFIPLFAYEPYRLADVISNLLLLLSIIFLEQRKYWSVFALSFIGLLVRESSLLIIPAGVVFVLLYDRKNILPWFISSFILISIFILMRQFFHFELGYLLFQQFGESWTKLFSPEVIVKQLFLSFNPLFLIPLLQYKELVEFFRKNLHWLILLLSVLFSSLFGGDKERLMFPFIPIYYLFIASLFQKLDTAQKLKPIMLAAFLFLCMISNLHHMWGLIRLPSREVSLTLAITGGIIMLLFYIKLINDKKVRVL